MKRALSMLLAITFLCTAMPFLTVPAAATNPFCEVGQHNWVNDIEKMVQPTCTQNGTLYYYCPGCGAERTESIPARHQFDDGGSCILYLAMAASGRDNSDYSMWQKAVQDAFWADVDLVVPGCMKRLVQNDVAQYATDEAETLLGVSAELLEGNDALQLKFSMYHRGYESSWFEGISESQYFEAMLAKYDGNLERATMTEGIGVYGAIGIEKMEGIYAGPPAERNGTVIKAPTCKAAGIRQYTCQLCGATENVSIPKLDFCPLEGYTDLTNKNSWYHDAAEYVVDNQIMSSTSTSQLTFSPSGTTSRAMVVQVLYNLERRPVVTAASKFTDVKETDWFYKAVVWASENGIVYGKGEGIFDPQGAVTREQFVSFLHRYVVDYMGHSMTQTADLGAFPDGATTSKWAADSVKWGIGCGMISGRNNGGKLLLAPKENLTRAELASVLMRFKLNPEIFRGNGKPAIIVM